MSHKRVGMLGTGLYAPHAEDFVRGVSRGGIAVLAHNLQKNTASGITAVWIIKHANDERFYHISSLLCHSHLALICA